MPAAATWDLIIIGGGAAGLWAAGTAAQRGRRVLVLEKNNKAGVKILISGGTRCNLTHHCEVPGILAAFAGSQGRFLKPAVHQLPPAAVRAELGREGLATKVEPSGKVFPSSDRALDVRDALVRRLTTAGAQLRCGVAVQDLRRSENDTWRVLLTDAEISAKKVLLCCGGLSYRQCGTTGDGYAWARQAGHTLVATAPALTPLVSPASWVHRLTGVTLDDVTAKISTGSKSPKDPRLESRGGFLWTHFGCSGPVPMNVSRYVSVLDQPQQASLQLDLLPHRSSSELQACFDPARQGRRQVAKVVQTLVPRSLANCLLERAEVAEGTTLAELTNRGRRSLLADLKQLSIPLSGTRGYAKAEVTRGGVEKKEINPHTLESRVAPGLFLAGEIIDLDGPIGGYNFQAAFSTGHTAALHV